MAKKKNGKSNGKSNFSKRNKSLIGYKSNLKTKIN